MIDTLIGPGSVPLVAGTTLHLFHLPGGPTLVGIGVGLIAHAFFEACRSPLPQQFTPLKRLVAKLDSSLSSRPNILRIWAIASLIIGSIFPWGAFIMGCTIGVVAGLRLPIHQIKHQQTLSTEIPHF